MLVFVVIVGCTDDPESAEYDSPEGSDWVRVEAGQRRFTCGLRSDGTIGCWGSETGAAPILEHAFTPGSVDIAAGDNDLCSVLGDGALDCTDPALEAFHPGTDLARLAIGYHVACAVNDGGSLTCWGTDTLPAGQGYSDVAVNGVDDGVCALTTAGAVECWPPMAHPDGVFERIDAGGGWFCATYEAGLSCWTEDSTEEVDGEFTAVDVGFGFGCGVTGGSVACWVWPPVGDLPHLEEQLPGSSYVGVAAGMYQMCALDAGGWIDCVEVCQPDRHGPTCR